MAGKNLQLSNLIHLLGRKLMYVSDVSCLLLLGSHTIGIGIVVISSKREKSSTPNNCSATSMTSIFNLLTLFPATSEVESNHFANPIAKVAGNFANGKLGCSHCFATQSRMA